MGLQLTHKELQLMCTVLDNVDELLAKHAEEEKAPQAEPGKSQRLQKLVAANLRVKLNGALRPH